MNRTTICRLQMLKMDHHTPCITWGYIGITEKKMEKNTILNPTHNGFSSPPSPAPEITRDRCSLVIVRVIVTVIGVLSVIVIVMLIVEGLGLAHHHHFGDFGVGS